MINEKEFFHPNFLATSTNGEIKSPLLQKMFGQLPNRQDAHTTVLSYHRWKIYLRDDIRKVGESESLYALIPDPVAQGKNFESVMRAIRGLANTGITTISQLAKTDSSEILIGPGFSGEKTTQIIIAIRDEIIARRIN